MVAAEIDSGRGARLYSAPIPWSSVVRSAPPWSAPISRANSSASAATASARAWRRQEGARFWRAVAPMAARNSPP